MRRILCVLLAVILIVPEAEGAVELDKELLRETKRALSQSELRRYVPYIGDALKESSKTRARIPLALAMGRKCANLLYFFPFLF